MEANNTTPKNDDNMGKILIQYCPRVYLTPEQVMTTRGVHQIDGGMYVKDATYSDRKGIIYRSLVMLVEKQPERNSKCPCGSGKKYKKCCGVTA